MFVNVDTPASVALEYLETNAPLTSEEARYVRENVVVRTYLAGSAVRRRASPVDGWLGVSSGLVKIENGSINGRITTITNFSAGCWFGEGSALKGGTWPFDAVALTDTEIVLLPQATFNWLLSTSFAFNRFLLDQLNARLAQFVERCVYERLHDVHEHVVHCLLELTDPRFYPGTIRKLDMTQEHLASLTGVSRSVVSKVLQKLQKDGFLRVDYRSITLLDLEGLRRSSTA